CSRAVGSDVLRLTSTSALFFISSCISSPSVPSPFFFVLYLHRHHRHLHSFPTRRSSDLVAIWVATYFVAGMVLDAGTHDTTDRIDRKSTRLNSSHVSISYAVFCLKKKNNSKDYI